MPTPSPLALNQSRRDKKEAALKAQETARILIQGYTIQPAIGYAGGAACVGWELIPPDGSPGPPWYFASKELCEANLERHKARYSERPTPKSRRP